MPPTGTSPHPSLAVRGSVSTVAPAPPQGGVPDDVTLLVTTLEAWSTESTWACPDPELWARLTSNITFGMLATGAWHAIYNRPQGHPSPKQGDTVTLQSLGISPWLLTDLLDRAEQVSPAKADRVTGLGDLFRLASKADTSEWRARSGFVARLYRWADSESPFLLALTYELGLYTSLGLDSQTTSLIHARLLANILENATLWTSTLLPPTLKLSLWRRYFEASPEMDSYMCRIASASATAEDGILMATDIMVGASRNDHRFVKMSQPVLEAWWPLVREVFLKGDSIMPQTVSPGRQNPLYTWPAAWSVGVVRLNPLGTWSESLLRDKIVGYLFQAGEMCAERAAMVIAAWPEPGVRYLLDRARSIPTKDPSSIHPVTATVAAAGYHHLLTDEEAMDLCLSPNGHYRQVGMLASGGATTRATEPVQSDPPGPASGNIPDIPRQHGSPIP